MSFEVKSFDCGIFIDELSKVNPYLFLVQSHSYTILLWKVKLSNVVA